jgi:hypothetical protein
MRARPVAAAIIGPAAFASSSVLGGRRPAVARLPGGRRTDQRTRGAGFRRRRGDGLRLRRARREHRRARTGSQQHGRGAAARSRAHRARGGHDGSRGSGALQRQDLPDAGSRQRKSHDFGRSARAFQRGHIRALDLGTVGRGATRGRGRSALPSLVPRRGLVDARPLRRWRILGSPFATRKRCGAATLRRVRAQLVPGRRRPGGTEPPRPTRPLTPFAEGSAMMGGGLARTS